MMAYSQKRRVAVASSIVFAIVLHRKQWRWRSWQVLTREWILNCERQGTYHYLIKELHMCDTSSYRNIVRMDVGMFEELLTSIAPWITYQDTVLRKPIWPAERLAVTLQFLTTGAYTLCDACVWDMYICNAKYFTFLFDAGETFQSLQYVYCIPS